MWAGFGMIGGGTIFAALSGSVLANTTVPPCFVRGAAACAIATEPNKAALLSGIGLAGAGRVVF